MYSEVKWRVATGQNKGPTLARGCRTQITLFTALVPFSLKHTHTHTHCCPKDHQIGLTVGRLETFKRVKGDFSALPAWRKWKVETCPFFMACLHSSFSFRQAGKSSPLLWSKGYRAQQCQAHSDFHGKCKRGKQRTDITNELGMVNIYGIYIQIPHSMSMISLI